MLLRFYLSYFKKGELKYSLDPVDPSFLFEICM